MTGHLIICDTAIRQDSDGRYCLNDLHKAAVAAGANKRTKEPGKWMANASFNELVQELTTQNPGSFPVRTVEGRNGGTYVCEELVYAYAMWISPAFHLKVIRAYKTLQTQGIAVAEHAAASFLDQCLWGCIYYFGLIPKVGEPASYPPAQLMHRWM